MKFPQSSSFCLSSFVTDLEIITLLCTVPCIDLAQGIETQQKTRQGGMAKLLCGNLSCGRKASFWFSVNAVLPAPDNNRHCLLLPISSLGNCFIPVIFSFQDIDILLIIVSALFYGNGFLLCVVIEMQIRCSACENVLQVFKSLWHVTF